MEKVNKLIEAIRLEKVNLRKMQIAAASVGNEEEANFYLHLEESLERIIKTMEQ